jgi:hypothetical protein
MASNDSGFKLEMDAVVAKKFADILSAESTMHADKVAHHAKIITNGDDQAPQY